MINKQLNKTNSKLYLNNIKSQILDLKMVYGRWKSVEWVSLSSHSWLRQFQFFFYQPLLVAFSEWIFEFLIIHRNHLISYDLSNHIVYSTHVCYLYRKIRINLWLFKFVELIFHLCSLIWNTVFVSYIGQKLIKNTFIQNHWNFRLYIF